MDIVRTISNLLEGSLGVYTEKSLLADSSCVKSLMATYCLSRTGRRLRQERFRPFWKWLGVSWVSKEVPDVVRAVGGRKSMLLSV